MKTQAVSRDYVTIKLNEVYLMKWKGQGKTATEFVRAIKEFMPEAKCDYKYVSKWLSGYMSPVKYLPAICKVLEVDISEFSPKTHADKYKYSSDYADQVEDSLEKIAVKNFKIDLTFFQGLRDIIPDFDNKFPVFNTLRFYEFTDKPYRRSVSTEAPDTNLGQGIFQITKGGKQIFLTKYDLKFIRALQIRISKIVTALFEAHQKELEQAEAEANARYWELIREYNPDFDNDNVIWTGTYLSDEELQDIDKFGIYTEKEEQKYKLPRLGTNLIDYTKETEE